MMKAARITAPFKDFEIVQVPIPQVPKGQVRIKVIACGVCHGDMVAKSGGMGVQLPRTPGHEVAGIVDEVGEGVTRFKKGDNVGIGWYGGPCGHCEKCHEDETCAHGKACGISFDGGYAEYMIAPAEALARIPEGMDHKEACSLLCAGVTTFNSIRHQKLIAGDLVAVQGIGGLGHLAVQFCNKLGYKVAAISSGKEKEKPTKELGAHYYIDASSTDTVAELKKLGGAKLIVCTAPHAKVIEPLIDGLAHEGTLLLLAAVMEPLKVNTLAMIMNKLSIVGWPGGNNKDSEDTMKFAQLTGVKSLIETFPLEKANEAFKVMMESKVKFRAVLLMEQ